MKHSGMPGRDLEEALVENRRFFADVVATTAGTAALAALRHEATTQATERAKFASIMACLPTHNSAGQYRDGTEYTCFAAPDPAAFQRLRGSVLAGLNGEYMIVGRRPAEPAGRRPATDLLLWKVGEGQAAIHGAARRDDGGFAGQLRLVRTTQDAAEACRANMLERMTHVDESMLHAAYDAANDSFALGAPFADHFVHLRAYGTQLKYGKNFSVHGAAAALDVVDVPLADVFQSCDQMVERYDVLAELIPLTYHFGTYEQLNGAYEALSDVATAE